MADVDLRTTVHERVRGILRDDILAGVLEPGAHLRQSALSAQLQVSVAPVSEALRDLAAPERGLEDVPHRASVGHDGRGQPRRAFEAVDGS